jgi:hypothetical protein
MIPYKYPDIDDSLFILKGIFYPADPVTYPQKNWI